MAPHVEDVTGLLSCASFFRVPVLVSGCYFRSVRKGKTGEGASQLAFACQMSFLFDVSSLFTNVPIDEAVQVIRHRLTQDDTLADRTTLTPDQVAELLDTCLRSTYFCYGGDFYKQQEGAAMGSPVSAAVANLYMEFFEGLALTQSPDECRPRIWKRYVDDTFCILRKGTVEKLLSHLNSIRPTIQFTVEVEKDGFLPFLDILLRWKDDGSLNATMYRKPMHILILPSLPCQKGPGQMLT